MHNDPATFLSLVLKYNTLFNRFVLRLSRGNQELADLVIKEAMEEAYEEDKFYDTPQLRSLLHGKIVAKVLALTHTPETLN